MIRLTHAALGAALALTVACAQRADEAAAGDSTAAAPAAATPLTRDSAAPAAAPAAATARSTAPVAAGGSSGPRSTSPAAAAVARSTSPLSTASMTGSASSAPSTAAASANADPVVVNKFMSYDAASKTVSLQVTAALTSQRGGFNFNGGSDGSQTITVPQGWTVRMHVRNVDAIPHSAILILDQKPLPNAPDTPAISRAYTAHVSDGLPAQTGQDDVEFRASKAGNYLIYCGVPGHGPSGMYIRFVVSADATAPSYSL